jgi:hypothetical protein
MEDVVHDKCLCGTRATFNLPGEKHGIACKECKIEGMKNVVHDKCPCGTRMTYNFPGEKHGIACKECMTEGMEDVVHDKCLCGTRATFNLPGEKHGIACKECKIEGMKNVVDPKCPCGTRMTYNFPGEKHGIACKECKIEGMEDVVNPVCSGHDGVPCPIRTYLMNGCSYCSACDPDPERSNRRKKFEDAFFKYAEGKIDLKKREFRVDFERAETTKKFARVDGIVFKDGIIVCIEVDENGHSDDSYACDESRMHLVTGELLQKYPDHDVAWVRVNPTISGLTNQWSNKAKMSRMKLFDLTIDAVFDAKHGVVYIG